MAKKVAAIPGVVVINPAEQTLGDEVSLVEQAARSVVISNDADYEAAAEITRKVKQTQKKVDEYWEPLRASTYKAYKDVMGKKKQMTDPLEKAEKILKTKIGAYAAQKERERRAAEEAARKAAQEEMDRKLAEAAAAEKAGDTIGAEMAMAEAEIMDDAAASIIIGAKAPKVEGMSTTKTWVIKNIDPSKVPIDIAGVVIRPVDEKAVLALIRATKGAVKIPGVEYEEAVSVSIRA